MKRTNRPPRPEPVVAEQHSASINPSGQIPVLVTSLGEEMATAAELGDLYHGRWRIEEAFQRLKHRVGLESVSGLSQLRC